MTNPNQPTGLTGAGKFLSVLLVLGLVALGAWIILKNKAAPQPQPAAQTSGTTRTAQPDNNTAAAASATFDTSDLADTKTSVPKLDPPQTYVPKDPNVIDIELSEYAGYAGLIVANNGLDPSDSSLINTKHGFKLRIKISEAESWSALNAGKMAASATTADVLAVYGRQFQVIVPAQIGYSRGADGLVVRTDIKKVNDLKGKIVSAAQFTESDFFIRYLAREAGLPIHMLPDLSTAPDADSINLVYCDEGGKAGDLFLKAVNAGSKLLAGCVTWAPKTTEIPVESKGKAHLLVSNTNLLIIADILIVNKGFADKNPDKVNGLVDALLAGNKLVRENPDQYADLIAKAFTKGDSHWDHAKAIAELKKVHLSNLPEQLAFFTGGITQGGSFANIYQSSFLSYGTDLIPEPVDSDNFLQRDLAALKKADASGDYKGQTPSILPIASAAARPAENDPVLSKDIRFLFTPNSHDLDMNNQDNLKNLSAIKRILDIAPGSHIIIVGHVDNSNIPKLRETGGDQLVQKTALEAMQLSKDRANEVMNQLVAHEKVDPNRLERVGKGWTQPVSDTNPDLNRRVEVQWFTLE